MAREAMAKAVMEHAHQFYDVGAWYVVAECWDVWSVLRNLSGSKRKPKRCSSWMLALSLISPGSLILGAPSHDRWRRQGACGALRRYCFAGSGQPLSIHAANSAICGAVKKGGPFAGI